MMTKIRSIQDSWLAKGILILTALSFMSLFGISGYLGSSGNNRPIIRVDDIVVSQDEITNQYNQELQTAKNLFGDGLEITDNMRNAILQGIVQKDLVNAILTKTADDLNVSIGNDLVRKIIYSQAEFMDANGTFSMEKFRRLLNTSGWSEQRYIETLRKDIEKQHLVQTPVENINVPKVMNAYFAKMENQKKVFKYITLKTQDIKIDRKMSKEELEQYYQDFSAQFMEPESRDVKFIVLSADKISSKVKPSDAEIETYYQENINQFVVPETRKVLQMMFENQADAEKAYASLNAGGDFYAVAKDVAKQDKAATDLGEVSKEMLVGDMGEAVFELKKGEITQPTQTELGWHIMKVVDITPMKETKLTTAKAKIAEIISKEKAYDVAYEVVSQIEDQIGAGKTLEDIASEQGVKINHVKGLSEDGKSVEAPAEFKNLVAENDFVDTAFSYNQGEISQVMETNDGFTIIKVEAINEAHPKNIAQVKGDIEKMWATAEKSAIAQEIINDVTHDLENGDDISEVAGRFQLPIATTSALKRNESFAGLNANQMNEMFQENIGEFKIIGDDEQKMIIVASKVINSEKEPSKEEMDVLRTKAKADMSQAAANELINAYGSNYKVRVKYKYLGLAD